MIITLIVVAIVIWLVFAYLLPSLPEPIKTVVTIGVALVAILYLLNLAGIV